MMNFIPKEPKRTIGHDEFYRVLPGAHERFIEETQSEIDEVCKEMADQLMRVHFGKTMPGSDVKLTGLES